MAQCHADATHEGSRISSMLCKYTIGKFPYYSSVPRQCNMKDPQSARCHASATHEGSQMSSVPCQRNTWRFPTELSAMPAQYMKAPEQARCHVSALHEGSRTSSETQKLLVQAIEETVRNVKFFLKANSVIEEQKSTVRFAGTCSWSDCISSPNISSFVGHGLMNGAVAPCSAFTSRVKVRMYMSLCRRIHTHTGPDRAIKQDETSNLWSFGVLSGIMSLLIWSAKLELKPNGHNMFGAISTVQFWCFQEQSVMYMFCRGNLWSWWRSTNVNGGRKEYQSDILYMRNVSPVFVLVTNLGVLKQLVFGHVWNTYSAKLQRLIDTSEIFWINM